jgi:hypothetical protein
MAYRIEFDPEYASVEEFARMYRACKFQAVPAVAPTKGKQWKRPAIPWREHQAAIASDETFEKWFKGFKGPNIGAITGLSRLFVVDLDTQKTAAALAWWNGLMAVHNNNMDLGQTTVAQRTGGGGLQYFFLAPHDWRPPTFKTPEGVDIRGVGGFVVLPPSRHESGSSYAWLDGQGPWECPIAEAPQWLTEAIDALSVKYGGTLSNAALTLPHEPHAPNTPTTHTPTPMVQQTPAGRHLDGREGYMASIVWAALVNERRDCPILITSKESEALMRETFASYVRHCASRLPDSQAPTAEALELEGRGITLFREKWQAALRQWDTKLKEHAAVPREVIHPPKTYEDIIDNIPDSDPPASEETDSETAHSETTHDLEPQGFDGTIPPPRPWAYGNILMSQAVTAVAAPAGVGKTTFSFQIAVAFAMNLKLGDWEPRAGGGGKVWLYNGEEPKDELDRRYLASCYESDIDPAEAASRVHYNSGMKRPLVFGGTDRDGMFCRSRDVDKIKAIIIEHGYKLFIIDPFVEFHNVPENDNDAVKRIGAILREIATDCNCSVLLFHHTPKVSNSDTAAGDATALRGGGALVGQARFVFTMFNMTKKDAKEYGVSAEERPSFVRIDDAKSNMAAMSGEPTWFQKLSVGLDNAAGVRPSDQVGVLRLTYMQPIGDEGDISGATAKISAARDSVLREVAAACLRNGHTTDETSVAISPLLDKMNRDALKMGEKALRQKIVYYVLDGVVIDGFRLRRMEVNKGSQVAYRYFVDG